MFEGDVDGAVYEGLESEEQFRYTAGEKDASTYVGAEVVIVRYPSQDLLLELDCFIVAAFRDVEIGVNTVFIFYLESQVSDFLGRAGHDDVANLVEKDYVIVGVSPKRWRFVLPGSNLSWN